MKKLLLALMMSSVSAFAQNVKIANPSAPSQNILSGITVNNSTNMVVPGSLTVSNNFSLTKGAVNDFIWTCTNANGAGAWLANTGTNSIPGSIVLTNNALFVNAITNVTSVGGGDSLRSAVSNNIFFIKSLFGSNGVSIISAPDTITIAGSGAGGPSTFLATNITTATGGGAFAWTPILQLTTTATTGNVVVYGQALAASQVVTAGIRIRDAATNRTAVSYNYDGGNTGDRWPQNTTLLDTLTGTTKTYFLEVTSNSGSLVWTNQATASQFAAITNGGINITIIQIP